MYSWVNLEEICPLEIGEFVTKARDIDTALGFSPDISKLDEYKVSLLKTKSDIEILVGELVSLLQSPDLQKNMVDNLLYDFLKKDLAGYMALMDESQERHIEAHDGEARAGVGRTMAFRGVLRVALYSIIYDSLHEASIEYNNLPEKFKVKDKKIVKTKETTTDSIKEEEHEEEFEREVVREKNTFLRILFYILSIKLSVLGGLERRKSTVKRYNPQGWRATYTKAGKEQLADTYKENNKEDIKEELLREEDLFGEPQGDEDVPESFE